MIYIYTATFIKIIFFNMCYLIILTILIKYKSGAYLKLGSEINTSCRQSGSQARDSDRILANIYEGTGLTHHNKHIQYRAK